ncbi:MAG TPA: hypothetical protein DDW91_06830 [Shewanella frigidimarina]|nr:hypothetical protein [Shewanella frigidimarina]
MSDLKPCPFCGSKDIAANTVNEESMSGYDSVECLNCGVEGMGWSVDDWNERALPEPPK